MTEPIRKPGVSLDLDRCGCCGSLQLSINFTQENGSGHGYRIWGDSYNGRSTNIRRRVLTNRDIREIRSYLRPRGRGGARMTLCTNRLGWANGRPIGGPYERAQCWECFAWAKLETVKAPFGLPGTKLVLKPHERPA